MSVCTPISRCEGANRRSAIQSGEVVMTIKSWPIKPYMPFWAERFPRSLQRSKPLIGLDIGSHSIKLVQLEFINERYQVQCYGVKSLPRRTSEPHLLESGNGIEETIKSLFLENGIDDTQVACSIRGPAVMVKLIQVPIYESDRVGRPHGVGS